MRQDIPQLKSRQHGVTLTGLLLWSVVIIVITIFGMRLIPAYIEFAAVKRAMVATVSDPALKEAGISALRQGFNKRASIDDIKSVTGKDLVIEKQNNQVVMRASYTVKKPLFANISLLIDFEASSH
ncbi:MAG: DUF4845 domain-containing protein [Nitrosomonas sp.]|nr:DUF4845 domain-containing protein [Nitrosomonas sp.]MCC7136644.1 DUF4845 domain-containing protein [Nitrosomonas sp.]